MAAQLDLTSGSGSSAVTETAISQSGINGPKVDPVSEHGITPNSSVLAHHGLTHLRGGKLRWHTHL